MFRLLFIATSTGLENAVEIWCCTLTVVIWNRLCRFDKHQWALQGNNWFHHQRLSFFVYAKALFHSHERLQRIWLIWNIFSKWGIAWRDDYLVFVLKIVYNSLLVSLRSWNLLFSAHFGLSAARKMPLQSMYHADQVMRHSANRDAATANSEISGRRLITYTADSHRQPHPTLLRETANPFWLRNRCGEFSDSGNDL